MKKQILLLIILYLSVLIIILYGFLKEDVEIVIPALLILVILLILGFIVNTYVLKQKYEIDENVLHLTKEILHELAIPISTIQANTLLLRRTCSENEKSLKRLGRIEDSSKRLERLYQELLYSIKKEIQTVEREKTDVVALIEERVQIMRLLKRNAFVLNLAPHSIMVDKIGFEKMLDNVLTNAMKYSSKEHQIEVTLKSAELTIKDYGIGMDDEVLKNVYNRYYQSSKGNGGEGIGLALVSAYCKDENIEMNIRSKKDKGTMVHFNLRQILTL
ncbi:MAG: Two-component sensor histidine kinase [uncultured Sulfurovum sp.]|uniref:histidine kinase n=1 Tax=uncultured Sulfurovum sp. TaxID=269237 RepID=A0A6S6UDE4_9BACT|nr:MAG: Two-component sensor histidine kinase [uncultured Sulfurovum sp.]